MIKEGTFGTREAVTAISLAIVTKVLYTSATVMVQLAGNAAWYMTLFSCAVSLIFFLLLCQLMKRFPENNITEIFELVLGKFIGKALSIVFVAYFLFYNGSTLREFLEMIKAYNLPHTPTSLIMLTFLAVCMIGVIKGLESIIRVSYVVFYFVIFGILFLYLLGTQNYNAGYLFPLGGYGVVNTMKVGVMRSSAYAEIFWLAILAKSVHGYRNFKKIGVLSLIISGVIISLSLLCYVLTFGYNLGQESLSGIFQLSRQIYFNRFLQRVESVFLFTWVISSLVTITLSLYITISLFCKAFNIKEHGPLSIPFAILTYCVAILPSSLSEVIQVNMVIIRQYSGALVYGVPLIVLLVAFIRGKKGERIDAKKA